MKILVTGADGFVGSRLVLKLVALGHEVGAAVLPTPSLSDQAARRDQLNGALTKPFDLLDVSKVDSVVAEGWDAVAHLGAVASGSEANRDPDIAWQINTLGFPSCGTAGLIRCCCLFRLQRSTGLDDQYHVLRQMMFSHARHMLRPNLPLRLPYSRRIAEQA